MLIYVQQIEKSKSTVTWDKVNGNDVSHGVLSFFENKVEKSCIWQMLQP